MLEKTKTVTGKTISKCIAGKRTIVFHFSDSTYLCLRSKTKIKSVTINPTMMAVKFGLMSKDEAIEQLNSYSILTNIHNLVTSWCTSLSVILDLGFNDNADRDRIIKTIIKYADVLDFKLQLDHAYIRMAPLDIALDIIKRLDNEMTVPAQVLFKDKLVNLVAVNTWLFDKAPEIRNHITVQ